MTSLLPHCAEAAKSSWRPPPPDIIEFAQEFVKLPGSARSESFNLSITPWLEAPLRCGVDKTTRIGTLVKPVQSGGSVFGEILILYWILFTSGVRSFLQYNWSNDKRARERWESRIEAVLKSCVLVREKMKALARFEGQKCEIDFGSVFFRMQGAFVPDNLDSDSVRFQINEEVHAWEPGHLKKARNRSTAVHNYKSFDISNAGKVGDQLHQSHDAGTKEWWQVKCPGCGLFHIMRTRWEESKPQLGGLRYDAEPARRKDGYDYNKIRSTLRYQMPCGYLVRDIPRDRRQLSLSGKYTEPTNTGAEISHRSWSYDAVTVDYIDWMQLIKDKHDALRARRYGDLEPWHRYITERECIFYDPDDVPVTGRVTLVQGVKKNRDGLPEPKLRLFSLDRQQGEISKGEFPYWWLLIRDVVMDESGVRSLLVYEGKMEMDEQVIGVLNDHKCNMWQGVADSGDDTMHVYAFCLQHGINAIKGGKDAFYSHEDGARRIFSPERPLHAMIKARSKFPYVPTNEGSRPDPREPMFWLYSKSGIRERLFWLRNEAKWETPEDVSEDYQRHQEAEERVAMKNSRTGETTYEWVQQKTRNDQFVNECYIAMQIEMAGMIIKEEKQ